MIIEKTVFILGAGASCPYGFPSAVDLRRDIIYNFPQMFINAYAKHYSMLVSEVELSKNFQMVIDAFRYSSTKSIDLFLSRNKHFSEIGKKIIAFLIASYEENSKFREDIENPKHDWYMHFFDLLTKEISNPDELTSLFEKDQVSFITFNYDRSLEYFLFESFCNSFITKRNELNLLFSKIKIIHVYGKIVPLPWESDHFHIHYGSSDYFGFLDFLANSIRIIFDERKSDIQEAQTLINEASKIFFLGFGYADENLKALDFSSLLNRNHWIYGTGMWLTERERRKIQSKLKGKNTEVVLDKIWIGDYDSVMLLREHL